MSNNITDILLEEDKRDIYFYIDKHIKKKYRFFLERKLREQELDNIEKNI